MAFYEVYYVEFDGLAAAVLEGKEKPAIEASSIGIVLQNEIVLLD